MNRLFRKPDQLLSYGTILSAPMLVILVGHFLVDVCASIVPASLNIFEQRWNLSARQSAWLLGTGSLSSGLAQPIFAWISDRTNNRLYGGLGLAMAVILIGSIGLAPTAVWVFVFYTIGMIGSGMFHPIAASTIGALNPARRSKIITMFFIAGMLGGVSGSTLAPRLLVQPEGFAWLMLMIAPVLGVAVVMHIMIRSIPHRTRLNPATSDHTPPKNDWAAIGMLYLAAATRFTVNIALLYLYVRWMAQLVATGDPSLTSQQISQTAAPWVGNLNAFTMLGMATGGLLSGILIRAGREKWPLVLLPLVFAPAIACFPMASRQTGYLLALIAGIGFASMVPVTITVAQRLLPNRTSLASGLMLGGAWSVAMLGPVLAEWIVRQYGLTTAFYATAGLLAVSGVILLPLRSDSIGQSVGR